MISSMANTMSKQLLSHVINKANISNILYKNSCSNSKIQKNNLNFEKKDIETRLTKRNVPKNFLYRIKDLINNEATYYNDLNNLEVALNEYKDNNLKYVLERFLDQFSKYRYKVCMIMVYSDGVVSDYEVI